MSVDLVVSAYKADLGWLENANRDRLFLYEKLQPGMFNKLLKWGGNTRTTARLPNVGKLDHTFCYHIAEHYDNLADWTVFAPDNLPLKIDGWDIGDVLIPGESVKVPHLFMAREWGLDGKLFWDRWNNRPDRNGTNWTERYYSGKIKHAELSFSEWSKKYIGFDPNTEPWPGYCPGSMFGVPKKAITYLPRKFYERLRDQLSHHVEPEEGHYLERLWLVIFTGKARYIPDEKERSNGDVQRKDAREVQTA